MILTKDHTPMTSALGTTNSISELTQMVGISIGAPAVRYDSEFWRRKIRIR
jgi:hypothetical protein